MLILKTLQWGEQHGYGISQAIRVSSGKVLQVETSSIILHLHRLERQRWVKAEWKQSESNQRAKFYKITKLGKEQLASDYERWGKMVTIEGIMTAKVRWHVRLFSFLRRRSDLTEEIESHLNLAIADRIARGQSPADARRSAMRELGKCA